MSAKVTISFAVPAGYKPGDYAVLYSNNGDGDIDWETPVSAEKHQLFPNGAGIYGYGQAPYGQHRYGQAHAVLCSGYGQLPYGQHPYGLGGVLIQAKVNVIYCGIYKFGFKVFDSLGNPQQGSSGVIQTAVHIAPPAPLGLKKVSYTHGYYTITGQCDPDIAGSYAVAGQHNGKDYYRRLDGDYYIYWVPEDDRWYIEDALQGGYPPFERIDASPFGEYEPGTLGEGTPVFTDAAAAANQLVLEVTA
ncbi:MAG: hypothetical protein WC877_08635 [Dehalococcoidales bacterium]